MLNLCRYRYLNTENNVPAVEQNHDFVRTNPMSLNHNCSVTEPDPGSGAFLTQDPGEVFFGSRISNLYLHKMVGQQIFFQHSLLLLFLDPGSGINPYVLYFIARTYLASKDGEVLAQVIRLAAPFEQREEAQVLRQLGGAQRRVHRQHVLRDQRQEVVVGHQLGLVGGGGVGAQAGQVQVRGVAQVKTFLHLRVEGGSEGRVKTQSRQSAKHTRWRERGWESPNSDEGIYTCGTHYIYVLCGLKSVLWVRACFHLAVLDLDPDTYWECGSGSWSM
jgi:hypothetical protein